MGYKLSKIYVGQNQVRPISHDPINLLTDVKYYYSIQGNGDNYTWTAAEALSATTWTITYWDNYATLTNAVLRNNALTYTWQNQSIGIWCRLKTSGNSEFFSAAYDWNGAQWWGMWIAVTVSQIVVSGAAYSTSTYSTLQDLTWHFMVLTFDWSNAYLYKDGTQVGTISKTWSVRSTKWISIWRFGNSSTFYNWDLWICFLTESSLSEQTVVDFYNATKWIYGISS